MSSHHCTACGQPAAATARFCGLCGAAITPGEVAPVAPIDTTGPTAPSPPPRPPLEPLRAPTSNSVVGGLGKLVVIIGVIAIGAAALFGYSWYKDNYARPKDLQVGDCLSTMPIWSNASVDKVGCSSSSATYKVLSNVKATGSAYPGNISSLESACESKGGTALSPDSESWSDGDHHVLCLDTLGYGY